MSWNANKENEKKKDKKKYHWILLYKACHLMENVCMVYIKPQNNRYSHCFQIIKQWMNWIVLSIIWCWLKFLATNERWNLIDQNILYVIINDDNTQTQKNDYYYVENGHN